MNLICIFNFRLNLYQKFNKTCQARLKLLFTLISSGSGMVLPFPFFGSLAPLQASTSSENLSLTTLQHFWSLITPLFSLWFQPCIYFSQNLILFSLCLLSSKLTSYLAQFSQVLWCTNMQKEQWHTIKKGVAKFIGSSEPKLLDLGEFQLAWDGSYIQKMCTIALEPQHYHQQCTWDWKGKDGVKQKQGDLNNDSQEVSWQKIQKNEYQSFYQIILSILMEQMQIENQYSSQSRPIQFDTTRTNNGVVTATQNRVRSTKYKEDKNNLQDREYHNQNALKVYVNTASSKQGKQCQSLKNKKDIIQKQIAPAYQTVDQKSVQANDQDEQQQEQTDNEKEDSEVHVIVQKNSQKVVKGLQNNSVQYNQSIFESSSSMISQGIGKSVVNNSPLVSKRKSKQNLQLKRSESIESSEIKYDFNAQQRECKCKTIPIKRLLTFFLVYQIMISFVVVVSIFSKSGWPLLISLFLIIPSYYGIVCITIRNSASPIGSSKANLSKINNAFQIEEKCKPGVKVLPFLQRGNKVGENIHSYAMVVPYLHNSQLQNIRKCKVCKTSFVNSRVKHCLRCNMCHYGYDHYCLWLMTCIDSINYQYFLKFVMSLCFLGLGIFIAGIPFLVKWGRQKFFIPFGVLLMIQIENGVSLGFCLYILGYHIWLNRMGVSTKQHFLNGMINSNNSSLLKSLTHKISPQYETLFISQIGKDERPMYENNNSKRRKDDHLLFDSADKFMETKLQQQSQVKTCENQQIRKNSSLYYDRKKEKNKCKQQLNKEKATNNNDILISKFKSIKISAKQDSVFEGKRILNANDNFRRKEKKKGHQEDSSDVFEEKSSQFQLYTVEYQDGNIYCPNQEELVFKSENDQSNGSPIRLTHRKGKKNSEAHQSSDSNGHE